MEGLTPAVLAPQEVATAVAVEAAAGAEALGEGLRPGQQTDARGLAESVGPAVSGR